MLFADDTTQPQPVDDETLVTYELRSARGREVRTVAGYRTGDYAVRRLAADGSCEILDGGGSVSRLYAGDWVIEHIPTGMMVTSVGPRFAFASFLVDCIAQAFDGFADASALALATAPTVPWMVESAQRHLADVAPRPLRHWAAEHGVRLHPLPLERAEALYG